MAKIGFLGCSYSAYDQKNVYKDSWTYQLAQKFPQHQYYNYALGGRGIDYLQWCLLDAKEQDIDIIFVNTTYPERLGYLIDDIRTPSNFTFKDIAITENFKLRQLLSPHLWASGGILSNGELSSYNNTFKQVVELQSVSENRKEYVKKFYKNFTKLYNFKNIILLNFVSEDKLKDPACVWHQMSKQFNVNSQEEFYYAGLILGLDDDHWSFKGNQWVLNNFVLNKETVDILNQP
jgi:hypothetical protein